MALLRCGKTVELDHGERTACAFFTYCRPDRNLCPSEPVIEPSGGGGVDLSCTFSLVFPPSCWLRPAQPHGCARRICTTTTSASSKRRTACKTPRAHFSRRTINRPNRYIRCFR